MSVSLAGWARWHVQYNDVRRSLCRMAGVFRGGPDGCILGFESVRGCSWVVKPLSISCTPVPGALGADPFACCGCGVDTVEALDRVNCVVVVVSGLTLSWQRAC